MSSLNVSGNIIGSGTALTNLNCNAITNKPDLSVYATNTILNSYSTSSMLAINNLNNKTNFTNLLVSGASTCSSSLNVLGATTLNNGATCLSSLNVKDRVICEGISIVDSSSYSGQYQLGISPPTGTTNSKLQTIKQGSGYNQVLDLQPARGIENITTIGQT